MIFDVPSYTSSFRFLLCLGFPDSSFWISLRKRTFFIFTTKFSKTKVETFVFQLTFTCSKSPIETLEKVGNVSKVYYKNAVLVFLLLTLNIFHTFFPCWLRKNKMLTRL